ncbi:MAG: hypothetical protein K8J08_09375 [Thermoanaerobaculia bacterium]|nr:hypothetical protein [Thermoanaerobaculia bacterium]
MDPFRFRPNHFSRLVLSLAVIACVALAQVDARAEIDATGDWLMDAHAPIELNSVIDGGFGVSLVLDDGSTEGSLGVSAAATAQQFLWFNRFQSPGPMVLQEIQVLFPSGPNMTVGAAVDLVVYRDPDGDPTNGANLLLTVAETIQAVDGATLSVYPLAVPLPLDGGGDILIGVIPRFIVSGVTSPTTPAALDTTSSNARSWVAVWTGDPPNPAVLPPDGSLDLVDVFQPGNWIIRGFGDPVPIIEVPTLGAAAQGLLILLCVAAAGWGLRRLRLAEPSVD